MTTATITPTRDERIAARRAELAKQRAARKDPDDLTLSPNERRAYAADTAKIDAKISAFNTGVETWATLPSTDADQQWLHFLTSARATIDAELLAMHPRIRNAKELEQQQRLTWSIKLIDKGLGISTIGPIISLSSTRVGELMRLANYETEGPGLHGPRGWRGSLKEVKDRIEGHTKRRAAAQAALDAVLLSDEERAAQDAESKQLRDAFNALHVRGSSDGLGYVVVDEDGAPRDLDTLTPIERKAFERMDTAERAQRQERLDRALGRS